MRINSLVALALASAAVVAAAEESAPISNEARATAIKKYDGNGDGRLADAEREAMRKQIFEERRNAMKRGPRRMPFPFPPEIVKKHDKDGDGELNDDEAQDAQRGLQKMFRDLHVKYDANGNGRLEPEEFEKIRADKAAGKLEEVPQMFLQMGPGGRPAGPGRLSPIAVAKQMDRDKDGQLNEKELQDAREELQKARAAKQK
jgi:hypothetical protein